jgi:hypothetical protein
MDCSVHTQPFQQPQPKDHNEEMETKETKDVEEASIVDETYGATFADASTSSTNPTSKLYLTTNLLSIII